MASPLPSGPGFTVAAVVLTDGAGRVLTVRKRGTEHFMHPGGKIEPGESSDATAAREVREELGLILDAAGLELLGSYLTPAANEPGHWLKSDVYYWPEPVAGERIAAEIAESRWVDLDAPSGTLAPLFWAALDATRGRLAATASDLSGGGDGCGGSGSAG
ncbi:MAG TPA: NUDIX domain-containing protein [Propioniciclava tarda]|uniref:NUDIX hydrolase n=1 Tax=Propioniciclava tarda TaxID=433330 RepID=UPI001FD0BC39|nr:NUDIX domain-containing protein [Propioniciclava tarda]HOA88434.1 NUDIX domain-containing protein [Propioniciclava tarda]HQA30887.1 NUDIX domain-containing protein [Propioniciclava tarda]HQD60979.1 NUDIX domain-containing protein [Propioniciclava tarda]